MNVSRSAEYLEFALRFNSRERSLRSMFAGWLPDNIIDCHVHVGQGRHIEELSDQIFFRPFCSFPDFDLDKSSQVRNLFYPGKRVSMLRFAMPFRGINHRGLNEYLIKECPATDRVALYGIPTDIEYTVGLLSHPRIVGLKMYYFFFVPPAREVYQFFPKAILEEAQSRGVPIILHLPGTAYRCLDQVERLARDFPDLRVVLAHLGGYLESSENLELAYRSFARHGNLRVDTAMVFSEPALKLALRHLGEGRILYGSDEPLDLLRVKMFQHPKFGFRLTSQYPYHWIPPGEYADYKHLAREAVHAHWQILLAIKNAVQGLPKKRRERAKEEIFFANSRKLFSFA